MSVTFRRILSFVSVSILFAIFSAPFLSASLDSSSQITDGKELIKAMYEKYKGKWYDKLKIVQKVTYYRSGEEQGSQIWTEFLDLPGKVRSNIRTVQTRLDHNDPFARSKSCNRNRLLFPVFSSFKPAKRLITIQLTA